MQFQSTAGRAILPSKIIYGIYTKHMQWLYCFFSLGLQEAFSTNLPTTWKKQDQKADWQQQEVKH